MEHALGRKKLLGVVGARQGTPKKGASAPFRSCSVFGHSRAPKSVGKPSARETLRTVHQKGCTKIEASPLRDSPPGWFG